MSIFSQWFSKEKQEVQNQERGVTIGGVSSYELFSKKPVVTEQRGKQWITFSNADSSDNQFPYTLVDYFYSCPLHAAIITAKAKMSAGEEILFNSLPASQQQVKYLPEFVSSPNRRQNLSSLLDQSALDLQVFGAMAFQMTWSLDYSRIVSIERVPVQDVRIGIPNDEVIESYWICKWDDKKKQVEKEFPAFNPGKAKQFKQPIQVLYIAKSGVDLDYYGCPEYISGLDAIAIEKKIIEFHAASLDNQFAPSLVLTFPERPRTEEESDEFFKRLKAAYTGTKNAGTPIVLFGENGILPSVEAVESARLDERLINLKDSNTESIIYAHRVSSPALLGIQTPGKLGMSSELPTAYKIFDKTVVGPDRAMLERTFTFLSWHFGCNVEVTIKPFNPLV